ncbi:MAG: type II toxin-antitoxin system VapC family toxin [Deferrisomatales bacterium]
MRVFFDTSAFVKRYVEEPGSDRVQELCAGADSLALSVLCLPELISTLNRLVREKKLHRTNYADLKARVLEDLRDAEVVNLTPGVVAQAVRFLEGSPLRALDALQLGCAAEVDPDVVVSADERQLEAGRRAGLPVVDVRA